MMHKTTVVIDQALLKRAMKAAGVKTKREAIEAGLNELVQARNREELRRELGSFDLDLTLDQLERLRSDA